MLKLKIIKTVVVIMTFILVFGSLLLLTSIYKKARKIPEQIPEVINLGEPKDSRINNILEYDGYLYITVKDGGEADRIIIFNPAKGEKISTIKLD